MCAETCKHLFGGKGLEFLGNQDPASYPTHAPKKARDLLLCENTASLSTSLRCEMLKPDEKLL